ncbi:DUF58 domain-containing protein [Angustibacter sp. Root456]|uniref:DUF58 domain-containing protein n=1 Tax=Angustibacter sp. Root456 TaxID=1736539 RepID=UPI0006FCD27B|nr:DUF58 domain-containing protein [Angustibacter sp. Root456]KQX61898.1 hypothetical protein ASD06_15230 [Angustibacter sp. Root456]
MRERAERLRQRLAGALGPAGRPVGRVLGWVSGLGWSVLALAVVALLAGRRFGWVELMVVAVACATLFVLCCVLVAGRTRLEIVAEVSPHRVTVGEAAGGRVLVTNHARRTLLPVVVELPIGVGAARFVLPTIASGTTHEELFVVPTEHRGVIDVGPATTVQGDPFGLVRRTLTWTAVTQLFVHPRTVPLESLGSGLLRDLEGDTTEDLSMSDLAFHALREYQPGDDRRYIHWRSSAKHGRLLVRQFLDTRRSHVAVVVDTGLDAYAGGEPDAETALSVGASIAVRSIRDEQDTTVCAGGLSASRTTAPLTLDVLARVQTGRGDLEAAAAEAVRLAPDASLAVVVTGPQRAFVDVRRATAHFEQDVRVVVLVVDSSARAGVQHVAGLTVLTLADLAELRNLLVSGVRS